ncbi:hypothetical protein TUBRATIS_24500 [Tubulinosema ratisbonensis]|uniref:Uncharacterized protein n=1 Tax=Tubulinosema ratisbonensis TaxID=291195 RepID=A0A437AJ33_9MICR|nr:hypothetical protein TUBRATIS_24500 [Tubulinosema ratisbonensis]
MLKIIFTILIFKCTKDAKETLDEHKIVAEQQVKTREDDKISELRNQNKVEKSEKPESEKEKNDKNKEDVHECKHTRSKSQVSVVVNMTYGDSVCINGKKILKKEKKHVKPKRKGKQFSRSVFMVKGVASDPLAELKEDLEDALDDLDVLIDEVRIINDDKNYEADVNSLRCEFDSFVNFHDDFTAHLEKFPEKKTQILKELESIKDLREEIDKCVKDFYQKPVELIPLKSKTSDEIEKLKEVMQEVQGILFPSSYNKGSKIDLHFDKGASFYVSPWKDEDFYKKKADSTQDIKSESSNPTKQQKSFSTLEKKESLSSPPVDLFLTSKKKHWLMDVEPVPIKALLEEMLTKTHISQEEKIQLEDLEWFFYEYYNQLEIYSDKLYATELPSSYERHRVVLPKMLLVLQINRESKIIGPFYTKLVTDVYRFIGLSNVTSL